MKYNNMETIMNIVRKMLNDRLTQNGKLLRIAHRGYVPENSMLGFKNAIARGCDMIECDVRLSVDKYPVIIHDKTVNRTTKETGYVHCLHKYELENYGVPSLELMLEWLTTIDASIYVAFELKDLGTVSANTLLLDNTLHLLQKYNVIKRSIIISFNSKIVQDAKNICPDICTGFIYGNTSTFLRNPFYTVRNIKADILWAHHSMIKPLLHLNKDNIPICIWTVNKISDITCFDKNVIGIVSDDLRNIFKE
jgi:glycerophosphoryl diester phosphodiesterase